MSLQANIIGLSLGYALLGLLLLLAVVRTRLPWPLKAVAIVVTSAFYVLVFFRSQGLLGWSAYEPLPARFQLLWVRSVEPNVALGERGVVHLWVEELDDDNLPSGVPRAYRRPYSTALARKVEKARTEIAAGHPQGGRAAQFGSGEGEAAPGGPPGALFASGEAGGDPSGGGLLDSAFMRGESQSIEFAPLPVPVLPAKDVP
ncbi:MAG: hypothetical protein JWR89_3870 [Tardiphaga sp.]|uniref:hypothetical protein n=1 Tax=Tardiphaga sp. TaxID=1926292 RepID=UPI002616B8FD|nr:hypothetical protein [Tardiphaga sp.]MDB5503968.1 hypothetical protein [Tardiphaga sp.]